MASINKISIAIFFIDVWSFIAFNIARSKYVIISLFMCLNITVGPRRKKIDVLKAYMNNRDVTNYVNIALNWCWDNEICGISLPELKKILPKHVLSPIYIIYINKSSHIIYMKLNINKDEYACANISKLCDFQNTKSIMFNQLCFE